MSFLRDLECGILSCLLEMIYDKNEEYRGYSPQERVKGLT